MYVYSNSALLDVLACLTCFSSKIGLTRLRIRAVPVTGAVWVRNHSNGGGAGCLRRQYTAPRFRPATEAADEQDEPVTPPLPASAIQSAGRAARQQVSDPPDGPEMLELAICGRGVLSGRGQKVKGATGDGGRERRLRSSGRAFHTYR